MRMMECGKVNAWYRRENSKPTVTICYELLKQVLKSLPKETTAALTPDDAKIGQVLWLTLHEVGHATFDIFGVPIFGNGEVAADNFCDIRHAAICGGAAPDSRRRVGLERVHAGL